MSTSPKTTAAELKNQVVELEHQNQSFKIDTIDGLVPFLSDLRQIKRLVGSLSVEEDELEQVWRIADKVQTQVLGLIDVLEDEGATALKPPFIVDPEDEGILQYFDGEGRTLKLQTSTPIFDFLTKRMDKIIESRIELEDNQPYFPSDGHDKVSEIFEDYFEVTTNITHAMFCTDDSEVRAGLAELAAADMKEMIAGVDFKHPDTIGFLYPALLSLKTAGLLKS
jgi:hypothetical protein